MDAEVGVGAVLAVPPAEATVRELQPLELLEVSVDGPDHFFRVRQALGLESSEHIAQGGCCQDPRGDLLGAAVGILCQVDIGIGEGVQGGGGGGDLDSPEPGDHAGGR